MGASGCRKRQVRGLVIGWYKGQWSLEEILWRCGGVLLQSHSKGLHFNGLVNFFSFILSNYFRLWTMRSFSMGTHLPHTLHTLTNTCSPHGKPCSIKLKPYSWQFISVLRMAMLPHTSALHMFMLLFHSATAMQLHHIINPLYAYPRQYW